MKIQIVSDLHLEFFDSGNSRPIEPVEGADVLVIAGDIHRGTHAFQAFADWPVPVIYIAGNHEFYQGTYEPLLAELRRLGGMDSMIHSIQGGKLIAGQNNTHFLERDAIILQDVRFLGTTLWTDYDLYGNAVGAMAVAGSQLNDHRIISTEKDGVFRPYRALAEHQLSRAWLQEKLDEPFNGKTVVVTHHGPHPQSIHPKYGNDPLNPAFASDLTEMMGKSVLWIHGHTHSSFDYVVNGTRVIANPAGYPLNAAAYLFENREFQRSLVVKI
ncbi:MAG: metallophosphoesterase [Burkholderiaceae bacterium]